MISIAIFHFEGMILTSLDEHVGVPHLENFVTEPITVIYEISKGFLYFIEEAFACLNYINFFSAIV